MRVGGKDGESLMGVVDVGVVNVPREFHNHEFTDRVLYVDAPRGTILVDGEVGGGDRGDILRWRYWAKDKGRGCGGTGVRGGGGDVVHNVVRGGSKLKLGNFKGHIVAGRLRGG